MTVLMNGLLDRNIAVRKSHANAIGHVVKSAKESSIEKLFKTLNTWYMEKEGLLINYNFLPIVKLHAL